MAALYCLDSLREEPPPLTPEGRRAFTPAAAFYDPHPAVRLHALRTGAAERYLGEMLRMVPVEKDPNVLLQLALSLGECDDEFAAHALARLAAKKANVRWMDAAVLSSVVRQPGAFLTEVVDGYPSVAPKIIEGAAMTAVAVGDKSAAPALAKLIAEHPDHALRLRLLELATQLGGSDPERLREVVGATIARASSDAELLVALRLISLADAESVEKALAHVFSPGRTPEFQEKAVRAVLAKPDEKIAAQMIPQVNSAPPRLAASIVDALLAHPGTALQYLESDAARASALSQLQRHRLVAHHDAKLKAALQKLDSASQPAVAAEDAAFVAALKNEPDLARGKQLFTAQCGICHQFKGEGKVVGPSLDGEVGRPAESLLLDILKPSAEITAGYATYEVSRKDGGVAEVGVLASESATSVDVVQAAGVTTTVLRKDIADIRRIDFSLMPATLAATLKPREVADIIGYLKHSPTQPALVLFEDNPAFAAALTEGRGKAKLRYDDPGSGRACLTVEGFQRYSRQLPAWKFPIRESSAEGEFRYLRLMMKTRSPQGIMIELADGGSFPPEDKPIRTYYAGKNSTGWTSNELAKEAPAEWRTFTIDLWQGNAESDFTLTGIAFTVMGGEASFDRVELLRGAR